CALTFQGMIKNIDNELKDGMYITVELPYGINPKAILIKDASIGTDQLGKYVYVVNDSNKVVYTPIKIGEIYQDSLRVVNEGLNPGERYVTEALLTVRNGMTVKPELTK
ncbi:MAG: efflux transporter periplasmic adaptor subunit, partial [Muribaculaceae bacterium]|nr:efflux transporter periplasmic adaptor subunit [Muribaculaceae bacterium]